MSDQRGQTAIEWLGVLLLVAILALGLLRAAPGIGTSVACGVQEQIAKIGGDGGDGACGKGRVAKTGPGARPARAARTPFGAPNRARDGGGRRPATRGRARPSRAGDPPQVQRVALPVIPALGAIAAACRASAKTCISIIKKTCKIPFAGSVCKKAKDIGCKIAKVYCKPKPKPKPRPKPKPSVKRLPYPSGGYKFERIRGGGGGVRVYARDAKGRATGISARLNPKAINQGTSASGRYPGRRAKLDDRTHLLAKELGGRGTRGNIVVASKTFNQKIMRVPERIARRELERGRSILYEAVPVYVKGQVRPVAVHVRITRLVKGRPEARPIYDRRLTGTR